MAIINIGKYVVNKFIATPSFFIEEVDVIGSDTFAAGQGTIANLKVSLTVSIINETMVEVGYVVINRDNRLLSYKGKFFQPRCSSVSEQLTRALAGL